MTYNPTTAHQILTIDRSQELCKRQSGKMRMRNLNLRQSPCPAVSQALWKDYLEQTVHPSVAPQRQSGREKEKRKIQAELSIIHSWWSSLTAQWTWPSLAARPTTHCTRCAELGWGTSLQTLLKLLFPDLPRRRCLVMERMTWWLILHCWDQQRPLFLGEQFAETWTLDRRKITPPSPTSRNIHWQRIRSGPRPEWCPSPCTPP